MFSTVSSGRSYHAKLDVLAQINGMISPCQNMDFCTKREVSHVVTPNKLLRLGLV